MRKNRSIVFNTTVVLLIMVFLIVAANTGYSAIQQEKMDIKTSGTPHQTTFYAEISFYTYKGEGCSCQPLRNAPISAQGLDTDHNDSGFTDTNGLCILELEFDATYQVTIEIESYQKVIFDFYVIDDQTFSFHMQEEDVSVQNVPLLELLTQSIRNLKNL